MSFENKVSLLLDYALSDSVTDYETIILDDCTFSQSNKDYGSYYLVLQTPRYSVRFLLPNFQSARLPIPHNSHCDIAITIQLARR